MMRGLLAALIFCSLCLFAPVANAASWASPSPVAYKHFGANLSAQCRSAARQGGPCGCWAAEHFGLPRAFGHLNLWLANAWLAFPHVAPAPGTAAVWPGRHVAPVIAVATDKVMVADSWATHWVSRRGLVFVAPGAPHQRYARYL